MFRPFATFADQHIDLEAVFRAHQAALMGLDLQRARQVLSQFSSMLLGHMSIEEEILIPAFAATVGELPRVGPEMIQADHKKLLEKLGRIGSALEGLLTREHVVHEDVIDLFDLELGFKRLLHHHDERERTGMFSRLDQDLSAAEKEELWRRVETFRLGDAAEQGSQVPS